MSDAIVERVTRLVAPLLTDLKLDLYDIEFRGGTLRITVDTPAGSAGSVDVDTLALVNRTLSRDFDHDDPIPGRYTLEVSSPGLERTLRTPAHFRREVGKEVALRLRDTAGDDRRVHGVLVGADDDGAVVRLDDAEGTERQVPYAQIDRAKTVFRFPAQPKPGSSPSRGAARTRKARATPVSTAAPASGAATHIAEDR